MILQSGICIAPNLNQEDFSMQAKARFLGHSIHQMLVVFPLGLLMTAVIFDIAYLSTANPGWAMVSFWIMAAGIIGAIVAAPFGSIDWLSIPKQTRARKVGFIHGLGNVLVLALFLISWFLRKGAADFAPSVGALICSFAGVAVAAVAAWFGGELVDRLGVGVDEGANLDASSSLTKKPAAPSKDFFRGGRAA